MVANIGPSSSNLAETLSTLRFAQRAKSIRNKAVVNEDTLGDVSCLQAEIARLKAELASARSLSMVRTQHPRSATESAGADSAAVEHKLSLHGFGRSSHLMCTSQHLSVHHSIE